MSIKIECKHCGEQNDLGRVFCVQCGKRLELTQTSLDELAERRTIDWGPIVKRIFGTVVLLAIVGVVGIAFWPQPPSTLPVDPAGVAQLPMKTRALQKALRAHQQTKVTLSEAELNGFLDARAKLRQVRQLTVALKPGVFTMAALDDWAPAAQLAGLTGLVIRISCDWTASYDNGTLAIQSGRFGHLPLPNAAATYAASQFGGWFDDVLSQTGILKSLKSVTIDEGKADLVFGP